MWASYDFVSFTNQNVEKTTTHVDLSIKLRHHSHLAKKHVGGFKKREPHDPTHKTTL